MIFTVGNPEAYEQVLDERGEGEVLKLGRDISYPGGTVFKNYPEALACAEEYSWRVYVLDASWLEDVESEDGIRGHLLKSAPIYRLEAIDNASD